MTAPPGGATTAAALALAQFDPQRCTLLFDQVNFRFIGCDLSFGFLNPRGECGGFLCRFISRSDGGGGFGFQRFGPDAGVLALGISLSQRLLRVFSRFDPLQLLVLGKPELRPQQQAHCRKAN